MLDMCSYNMPRVRQFVKPIVDATRSPCCYQVIQQIRALSYCVLAKSLSPCTMNLSSLCYHALDVLELASSILAANHFEQQDKLNTKSAGGVM